MEFGAFLDRYGWRTEDWDPSTPTWRDHPEKALALVRRNIADDIESPAEAVARAAGRREERARDVEERLADGQKRVEFRRLYAAAAVYMTIKEGRAHWQLSLNGHLGAAFRRLGARLAREGRIAEGEDVFYLTAEEIDAGIGGGRLQRVVEQRKAERERWLGVIPPRSIGGESPEPEAPSEAPATIGALKGVGASRGRVTAVARVLAGVADGARLQPGEVLVCATTTPTWTPLFAIAGAIVTDGGGILSHPAIAAREYGIAAVVGTKTATSVIRDGVVVTVDGEAGTVEIEERV